MRVPIFALPSRRSSVQQDWCIGLPPAKAQTFDACVRQLESYYRMFSVSLNEVLELRRVGKSGQSCQALSIIPALCGRLAVPVESLLRTLAQHARHFGVVPNTVPLDASNFRGGKEQHTARMSELLSHVLFTQRSQFLHKIDTLEEMVFSIRKNFTDVAADLLDGSAAAPSLDWRTLDDAHYDLNTCLREAIVLLKSFLVVLPDDQLQSFQKAVCSPLLAPAPLIPTRRRRMAAIEGQ